MNTQNTTEERVHKVLTDISGNEKITNDQNLTTDLGLSSLRMFELVIAIEDEFNIMFNQSDLNFYKLNNKWTRVIYRLRK